ncbi:MAG: MBL fold metallo-hydrolase [Bacilli bacterium]|nr:MBL fold metallo-hydrolase [Bacilli bacterium]
MNIEVFTQSSIKIKSKKTVYFDPYQINASYHDADYIFITHDHYDHYDEESIKKLLKKETTLIIPTCLEEKAQKLTKNTQVVQPEKHYKIGEIEFDTIRSYNINKIYHPKEKNYVGYNVLINKLYYYIMGDTDRTKECDSVKTDICFIPIGGTYTMNYKEATDYINYIKPKKVIPTHYGTIVGDISLKDKFKKEINSNIEVEIHIQ